MLHGRGKCCIRAVKYSPYGYAAKGGASVMHKQSGTSECQVKAGRAACVPRSRFMPGRTWPASLMGKGMGLKVSRLAMAVCCAAGMVTGLLCVAGPAVAQQASWDDGQDDTPMKPVVDGQTSGGTSAFESAAAPLAASASVPYKHYSNNRQTNARLNAVFDIIATQGDGLVWDSEHHLVQPKTPVGNAAEGGAGAAGVKTAAVSAPKVKTAAVGGPASAALAASSATTTVASAAAPIGASTPSTPSAPPAPVPQTWAFAASGSLQETLISWARQAGWETPAWQASQPYTIMSTQPITGTFLDAVKAIATAEPGLDINVSMTKRTLKIVDHKGI